MNTNLRKYQIVLNFCPKTEHICSCCLEASTFQYSRKIIITKMVYGSRICKILPRKTSKKTHTNEFSYQRGTFSKNSFLLWNYTGLSQNYTWHWQKYWHKQQVVIENWSRSKKFEQFWPDGCLMIFYFEKLRWCDMRCCWDRRVFFL